MTHPKIEELTDFLYDELETPKRAEIQAHLATCDECRARVSGWRGVRRELSAWTLPETQPHATPQRRLPVLRWAVAAAVLVGAGVGLARATQRQTPLDTTALRAQITRDVRDELGRTFAAEQARFVSDQASRHAEFERAVAEAIGELEARQIVAHAALRKDVETLAIQAQQSFDQIAYTQTIDKRKVPQEQ